MNGSVDQVPFSKMVSDEKRSFNHLLSGLGNVRCPSCSCKQYYILGRRKIRCSKCRKDYNPLLDSKFSKINIPYRKWLVLTSLFAIQISARRASVQAGVSYKTALNAFRIIRKAILEEMARNDDALRHKIEVEGVSIERKRKTGKGAKNKIIVVGILERRGKIAVDILQDIVPYSLLNAPVKRARRGGIVYTDKWMGYDSLMFYDYEDMEVAGQKKFVGKVYIDGKEGFWRFAKERIKYHGLGHAKFLYYIKEMEWRYNNKAGDLFDMIIGYMLVADQV